MRITITLEKADDGRWNATIEDWFASSRIGRGFSVYDAIETAISNNEDWLNELDPEYEDDEQEGGE